MIKYVVYQLNLVESKLKIFSVNYEVIFRAGSAWLCFLIFLVKSNAPYSMLRGEKKFKFLPEQNVIIKQLEIYLTLFWCIKYEEFRMKESGEIDHRDQNNCSGGQWESRHRFCLAALLQGQVKIERLCVGSD